MLKEIYWSTIYALSDNAFMTGIFWYLLGVIVMLMMYTFIHLLNKPLVWFMIPFFEKIGAEKVSPDEDYSFKLKEAISMSLLSWVNILIYVIFIPIAVGYGIYVKLFKRKGDSSGN